MIAFNREIIKSASDEFYKLYNVQPNSVAFAPYRVCPLGAHCDHQLGKITGFAIDKGIYVVYSPRDDGLIEIKSLQFPKKVKWSVYEIPEKKQNDWADYLRGASAALKLRHHLSVGLRVVVAGELPIGGLSSSASVIISFLSALCNVNNIKLNEKEIIEIVLESENKYVGVSCGKLDQSCEVYCKKDNLLYMDLSDDSVALIPQSPDMKPYEIAVFFSGVERALAGSKYNMRVDECRSAAYALKAYEKMEYGKFSETNLREIPFEVYLKHKHKLPESWQKRAEHWYSEFKRVEEGVDAWQNGDIEKFGKLCFESGKSSIYNWETGSPELKKIYEIMTETDGIYGGRFSGAGFKGCCVALIDPSYRDYINQKVKNEYLKAFPDLSEKYSAFFCHNEDGVKL